MITKNLFAGVFVLLLVGSGLGVGYNLLHPNPLPWIAKPTPKVTLEGLEGGQPGAASAGETALTGEPATRSDDEKPVRSGAENPPTTTGMIPPGSNPAVGEQPVRGKAGPPAEEDLYGDVPQSQFPIEVGLGRAKDFYDRGGLLVLDAREPEEFAEGHIQGAQMAPTDVVSGDLDWLDEKGKDPRPILVYCGGGDCELAHDLGFQLTQSGHRRVLVLTDGYPAWEKAGYPTRTGASS